MPLKHSFLPSLSKTARWAATGAWALLSVSCADGPPDEPVVFQDIRVEELGARRAVVRFDTSRPTSCEIEYGLTDGALTLRATDPDMAEGELSIEHEVALEDLLPQTTYFFRARAEDDWDQVFRSAIQSFSTQAAPASEARTNLALLENGAMVSVVSSNWGDGDNDSGYGANRALDGQMGTEWSSNGDGNAAFLEVDLGAEKVVDKIAFRSREMSDGTAMIQRVSFELKPVGRTIGPLETPDPNQKYELSFEPLEGVRYVRMLVEQSTGGNTGAREIEVYGP